MAILEKETLIDFTKEIPIKNWTFLVGKRSKNRPISFMMIANNGLKTYLNHENVVAYNVTDSEYYKILTIKFLFDGNEIMESVKFYNDTSFLYVIDAFINEIGTDKMDPALQKSANITQLYGKEVNAPIKFTYIKTDDGALRFQLWGLSYSMHDFPIRTKENMAKNPHERERELYLIIKEQHYNYIFNVEKHRFILKEGNRFIGLNRTFYQPSSFPVYTYKTEYNKMVYAMLEKLGASQEELSVYMPKNDLNQIDQNLNRIDQIMDMHLFHLQFPVIPINDIPKLYNVFNKYVGRNIRSIIMKSKAEDLYQLSYEICPKIPRNKHFKDIIRNDGIMGVVMLRFLKNVVRFKDINHLYGAYNALMNCDNLKGPLYYVLYTKSVPVFMRDYIKICGESKMVKTLKTLSILDNYYVRDMTDGYVELKRRRPELFIINGKHMFIRFKATDLHDEIHKIVRHLGRENFQYKAPKIDLNDKVYGYEFKVATCTLDLMKIASTCRNCALGHESVILKNKEHIIGMFQNGKVVACISGSFIKNRFTITEAKRIQNYPLNDDEFLAVKKWMERKDFDSNTSDVSKERKIAPFAGGNYYNGPDVTEYELLAQ